METYKGRLLEVGQWVKVYRNLHKEGYSIQDRNSGLVVAHSRTVTLSDCMFIVRESGRQRVLKEHQRNVHAYVVGRYLLADEPIPVQTTHVGYYNPYKTSYFVSEKGEIVESSPMVHCEGRVIYFE